MSAWRTGGIGPEKTGAGLRGIGLIAIVLAFLTASNTFLSGSDDDAAPTTTASARLTVIAPEALRAILPAIEPDATYVFGTDAALRARVENNEPLDLYITGTPGDAQALAKERRCTDALALASKPPNTFVACIPTNASADTSAGLAYLETVTGLKARAALIDAGFDLPDR